MKTPEEIKKGLMCGSAFCNIACPYWNDDSCTIKVNEDALAYIQQLEAGIEEWEIVAASPGAVEDMARENAELLEKIKRLERERDAAVNDLSAGYRCGSCTRYFGNGGECPGGNLCILGGFDWRGPCAENTENP